MIDERTIPIQSVLDALRQHPALQTLEDITSAADELSHDWHSHLHFTARATATGRSFVIKTGVTDGELYWTEQLARVAPDGFPQLLAANSIPTTDDHNRIHFIVTENLPHRLIGSLWQGRQTDLLLDAAACFYQATLLVPARHLSLLSWEDVSQWLTEGIARNPPGDWRAVVSHAERDYAWLLQTCPFVICHGDLHVGNALSRTAPPDGVALLIDINPVLQPWVFDAAWIEACAWSDQEQRGIGYTIQGLAGRRRNLGLDVLPLDVQEKAGRIALSWFAIRNWDPDHLEFMVGFREATEAFINSGASIPR